MTNKQDFQSIDDIFEINSKIYSFFILILVPFSINSRMPNEKPTEEYETNIYCDYTKINSANLKSVKWYKNDIEIINNSNSQIINDTELKFTYLNHSIHNGVYKCKIELITGQLFQSENINITVYC